MPLAAGVGAGVYLAISAIIADQVTRARRKAAMGSPADLGLPFQPVTFPSHSDRVPLEGWLIPGAPERPWIITVHGRSGNRASTDIGLLDLAHGLHAQGYNLLTFDLRGHGQSAGARHAVGTHEQRDVLGALEFLRSLGVPEGRIGLIGFSLGAVASLMAAVESPALLGVVADSSFADVEGLVGRRGSADTRVSALFRHGVVMMGRLLFGVRLKAPRPIAAVQRIRIPILFIHGARDRRIPPREAERLWLAAPHPDSRLWVVPGAAHVATYLTQPQEYLKRVDDYFTARERDAESATEKGRAL